MTQIQFDFTRIGHRKQVVDESDLSEICPRRGSVSNCKAILGAMATFGLTCWASIETLSKRTGLAPRTVQRSIATLAEVGLMDIERGRRVSNSYYVKWQKLADLKFGEAKIRLEAFKMRLEVNQDAPLEQSRCASKAVKMRLEVNQDAPLEQSRCALRTPYSKNNTKKETTTTGQTQTEQVVVVSSLDEDWETQRSAYHAAIDRAFDQAEGQGRAPGDILLRITINGAGNDPVAQNAKPGPSMGAESLEQVNPVDPWDAVRVALKAANVGQWSYALNAARSQGATVDQCLRAIGSSTEPGVIYNRMVQGCVETVQQSTERVRPMPNRERIRTALYAQWRLLPVEQRTSEALEGATDRAYARAMAQWAVAAESPQDGGQVR